MISSSDSDDKVLSSDAICVQVPTDDIRIGDSVVVLPGETIPVDVSYIFVSRSLFILKQRNL